MFAALVAAAQCEHLSHAPATSLPGKTTRRTPTRTVKLRVPKGSAAGMEGGAEGGAGGVKGAFVQARV